PTSVDDIADRVRLADRIEQVNLLQHVVNRTKKSEVIEMRVHRNPVSHFVELKDIERKFYDAVTSAIRHYAKEHGINQGFLLANPQRQVSSCMYAAAKLWSEQGGIDLDLERNMLYETGLESDATTASATGASPLRTRLVSDVLPGVDLQQLWDNDSKFGTFITEIEKYFAAYPQEKIVVFSYFRATLRYLEERLDKIGIRGEVLMGGMQESKQKIINRFREDDSIRVLLSSEVASEGVDLQFCRVLVNYDLPWNPMRIEQRIGRLDRIGQKAEQIHIWNLCYADTIDQRIYERLFERLKIFERALGDMEAILGEQVAELTGFLMSQSLTPKQEEDRIAQTATAIENRRQTEEMLEKEAANLLAHGGYILERVKNAQKLKKKITEGDLIVYVRDYLDKYAPGHTFHQPGKDKHRVNIKLPPDAAAALEHYAGEKKLGHTRLVSGLEVPCEFINKTNVAAGRTEQISQFHPFVRFISGKIDENGFHPVVAIRLRRDASLAGANLPAGQYAFAVQKWSFGGLREEIDMRVRMMHMENGAESPSSEDAWELLNAARLSGADWPEVGANVHPDLSDRIFDCNDDLRRDFDRERERKETENKDRVNLQIRSTEKHRDRQLASLNRVLENHRNRGQLQMIPATEGRIKSIKSRFEVQIEKLNLKEGLTPGRREVCCGVLFLES
ncbi:MAG: hypothetical protein MPL62_11775, partial [Alphaproteobacteria bacterium]|nr:hypothetical protein [Alphaproteobacteria bacterium]